MSSKDTLITQDPRLQVPRVTLGGGERAVDLSREVNASHLRKPATIVKGGLLDVTEQEKIDVDETVALVQEKLKSQKTNASSVSAPSAGSGMTSSDAMPNKEESANVNKPVSWVWSQYDPIKKKKLIGNCVKVLIRVACGIQLAVLVMPYWTLDKGYLQ